MMEASETNLFLQGNVYLPFNRVPFVTATKEPDKIQPVGRTQNTSGNLDGAAASHFYNQLISQPSRTTQKSEAKYSIKTSREIPTFRENQNAKTRKRHNCNKSASSNIEKLHRFAQDGNLTEIMNCIEIGANLDAKDSFGWTPLMCAVSAGHVHVIKCLLQHGANSEIKSSQSLTALDIGKKQDVSPEILNLLMNPYQFQILQKVKMEPVEKKVNFCRVCKKEYRDFKEAHERSIAHLFNCKSKVDKTFYHIPEHNKGFQIMLKKGWDGDAGLGPNKEGRKYPIKTVLKTDRFCIGRNRKEKQRITHFGPNDTSAVEVASCRKLVIERERTLKKREREKLERKKRRKEIAFRREFHIDT